LTDADVNECADGNNGEGCSYRCRNIDGGFFCQCPADGRPPSSAFCVGTLALLSTLSAPIVLPYCTQRKNYLCLFARLSAASTVRGRNKSLQCLAVLRESLCAERLGGWL